MPEYQRYRSNLGRAEVLPSVDRFVRLARESKSGKGQMDEKIRLAAEKIVAGKTNVAFTGAGISVESGIPDFRSPGGLWQKFDPMEYATIEAFQADPEKVWVMLREMHSLIEAAVPNPAHEALAELESLGLLAGLITQNIDNLHQEAGNSQVIEFHGNATALRCLECGVREAASDANERMQAETEGGGGPPLCGACGAILKPDVVLFGEAIPPGPGQLAMELSDSADVFIIVGTSGTVAPASYLPVVAKRAGGFVIEVNLEPTPLSDVADLSLHGRAEQLLPAIVERVRGMV
jgi:NAD-dependent deacetylase